MKYSVQHFNQGLLAQVGHLGLLAGSSEGETPEQRATNK